MERCIIDHMNKFVEFTPEEEALILSKVVYRKYLKNQYIVQQGDISKAACYVKSGCAKTFFMDKNGQERVVVLAIEDWWTSDLESFLYQKPADYNVQCLEDTEIIQCFYKDIEELYIQIPKLERFWRKMMESAYIATQKRILRSFTLTAKERYLLFKQSYSKMEQRIPQYLVASYLGITKEFLSKIKSDLLKDEKNFEKK